MSAEKDENEQCDSGRRRGCGMMAAIAAAKCGHNVTLLEKNEKLGKKLFITGKGRCNVTNGADMDVLFQMSAPMKNSCTVLFTALTIHRCVI